MTAVLGGVLQRRRLSRWAWVEWAASVGVLVGAAAVVRVARWGPDWPAQEFRAWTAQHFGLTVWTNFWFAGEPLPGYSVLYPPVAAVLGARLTGLVAVAVAAYGAGAFVPRESRIRAAAYRASVGFVLVGDLLIGQLPFLLGIAAGVCALRVLVRTGPWWLVAVLAAASSLASPMAGAFLLLTAPAVLTALGLRRAVPLGAALAGIATSALLGGSGGPFPWGSHSLIAILAFVVIALLVVGPADRAVQVLMLTYALASIALALVPNPLGGNMPRFGQLVGLPMFWVVLPRLRVRSRLVAAVVAGLAIGWPATPTVSSAVAGATDPSQSPAFYTGLLTYLHTQPMTTSRIEVVSTREHWESLWIAREFPIARGWERQTDLAANPVLYRPLSTSGYRAWLDDNAVSLVALPNAPIDLGGRAEAALLAHPPSYLQPVWHDANWRVWRVTDATPLVTGPATLRALGPASFVLDFRQAGRATVRIRASGMWSISSGRGCVGATAGQRWLLVSAPVAETLVVRSRIGMHALAGDADSRCS